MADHRDDEGKENFDDESITSASTTEYVKFSAVCTDDELMDKVASETEYGTINAVQTDDEVVGMTTAPPGASAEALTFVDGGTSSHHSTNTLSPSSQLPAPFLPGPCDVFDQGRDDLNHSATTAMDEKIPQAFLPVGIDANNRPQFRCLNTASLSPKEKLFLYAELDGIHCVLDLPKNLYNKPCAEAACERYNLDLTTVLTCKGNNNDYHAHKGTLLLVLVSPCIINDTFQSATARKKNRGGLASYPPDCCLCSLKRLPNCK
jgi:hypothetical protein